MRQGRWTIRTNHVEDNAVLESKLALRRHFLRKYHMAQTPAVLDCCQADAAIWSTLRAEFSVRYWGVDRVAKSGRLAIDSVRLLGQRGLPYDVIDVDTYGSPWQHWQAMLPNIVKPTTVFLTLGRMGTTLATIDSAVLHALGLRTLRTNIPKAILWKMERIAVPACLALAHEWALKISEAVEVYPPAPRARYFGLHVHP
jgi:hypothetical protein